MTIGGEAGTADLVGGAAGGGAAGAHEPPPDVSQVSQRFGAWLHPRASTGVNSPAPSQVLHAGFMRSSLSAVGRAHAVPGAPPAPVV